ncbi:hypothetical protein CBR_g55332 [Chara braunii]|uniref:DNA topoisomerase 2 n=1 Tax=Chara braunii TaxID=69332 RepID=A0A388MD57_CHABU|nr:hypothetical protein CBR_g55332 [Chara braunii]|eukprot:GBG92399.1 hypothetical protein CBR_g55332 [Chara braunii]
MAFVLYACSASVVPEDRASEGEGKSRGSEEEGKSRASEEEEMDISMEENSVELTATSKVSSKGGRGGGAGRGRGGGAGRGGNAKAPLRDATNDGDELSSRVIGDEKTIEEVYQKKTQLEHILLRPDTYVGSIEKLTQHMWVYEDGTLRHRAVTFVPGLYKIFDEILVNAADNKQRDPSMDAVKVDINPETNTISVFNTGDGVPVEIHAEEGVYVPEMIFGHLLTSSNYDDTRKKTTGGRNGYGAKLTNIFSTEFVIETADGKRGRRYKQVFSENMGKKSDPKITTCKASENWTRVTFKPDLAKFGMDTLEHDVVALMSKRVLDVAGVLGKSVKVELNGTRLPIKSFSDYVGMYLDASEKNSGTEVKLPRIYEKVNDRWEVCVSLSEGQFQQVSFVNAINTTKGGTHVNYVSEQVVNKLLAVANKKNKQANLKPFQIKCHLWVFVNALIENPAFDSQTKETLTTRPTAFGSPCTLSEVFLKKVVGCGIVEELLSFASTKLSKELKKNDGTKRQRLTGIPKLDDANDAGGKNSEHCTLILTEGDSAKALAVSGLSVVGRDRYGVFPLRGKLLNVREASHKQIMENAEINQIKQIMGLQHGKEYDSVKSLRYGHLMIMTDQDHDGSHIKGLLINFIHSFWPSLLKVPNFLLEFITPIVKATKGGRTLTFYTMPEYDAWKESLGGSTKGWSVKYYKGLGTSSAKEAKEYFSELDRHRKDFEWRTEEDGEAIELAFSKKKIEDRKRWLRNFEEGTYIDLTNTTLNYTDFVNQELILFSMADLARSIPSAVDGLKPGQRKILFSCFKRNLKNDIKVAQLSGYVSEHSAYHHGEASLSSTIVNMAQDFVGSNNVNLLMPSGQFGTRLQGGKDAASPRYIYTRLSPLTRMLFPEADDGLLSYLNDDGQSIEPKWYMPILPTVLLNGAEGIGTGWSTFLPNYNPLEITENIRRLMRGEDVIPMHPWYRGFKGIIEQVDRADQTRGKSYVVSGTIEQVDETTLRVTELPIRKWTQDYKEFLETLLVGNEKTGPPFIKDYKEYHTDTEVLFEIQLSEENMAAALEVGLYKKFKMTTNISTSNVNLFDPSGQIRTYDGPEDILKDFYKLRLEYYSARKASQLEGLQYEMTKLDNKVRFILMVIKGEIIVSNRKKADLLAELKQLGFTPLANKAVKKKGQNSALPEEEGEEATEEEEEDGAGKGFGKGGGYDYLLSMPIWSLTLEKVEELLRDQESKKADLETLMATTPSQMWDTDLTTFLAGYEAYEKQEQENQEKSAKQRAKAQVKAGIPPKKAAAPKRRKAKAAASDDEDDIEMDADFEEPKKKTASSKAAGGAKAKPATTGSRAPSRAPSSKVTAVAGSKDGVGGTKVPIAKKAAAAKATAGTSDSGVVDGSSVNDVVEMPEESMSLQQRLAKMTLSKNGESSSVMNGAGGESMSVSISTGAASKNAAKGKGRRKMVVDSDGEEDNSDEDFKLNISSDDEDVFKPKTAKGRGRGRGAAGSKPTGAGRGGVIGGAVKAPPKPRGRGAAKKSSEDTDSAEKKRARAPKPPVRQEEVIIDTDDEIEDPRGFGKEVVAESPAVKSPAMKLQRLKSSPFGKKKAGTVKTRISKAMAAAKTARSVAESVDEGGDVSRAGGAGAVASSNAASSIGDDEGASNRPARRAARTTRPKTYYIDSDSENENNDEDGDFAFSD